MDAITTFNLRQNMASNKEDEARAAVARDYFYNQDHGAIKRYLALDLQNTYSLEDIPLLKYITIDFLVSAFLTKLVNLYNEPPVFRFDESVPQKEADKFYDLMDEIEYQSFMQDTGYKTRLHNTILTFIRFNKDLNKVFVGNDYNVGNCEVVTWPGYNYEARIVAYEYMLGDELVWVVWDKKTKEHYIVKEFKFDYNSDSVVGPKLPIPGNEDTKAPDYWPWQIYRHKKQNEEFWGNGLDAIVELNRVINVLFTVCADDVINETLAVWLYNFNPNNAGNKRTDGRIKVGFRNPLFTESRIGQGSEPNIQVARADLFVNDIISFVETLMGMISNLHGVDNVLKTQLEQNLSGIAIRLRNEPLLRQWKEDIQIYRRPDLEFIKKVVDVNNYYRDGTRYTYDGQIIEKSYINPKILDKLTIDYQEPTVVTDEKQEFEVLQAKARVGLKSLVSEMQKNNPEMSETEALEKLKENIEEWDSLFASQFEVTVSGSPNEEDEDA